MKRSEVVQKVKEFLYHTDCCRANPLDYADKIVDYCIDTAKEETDYQTVE